MDDEDSDVTRAAEALMDEWEKEDPSSIHIKHLPPGSKGQAPAPGNHECVFSSDSKGIAISVGTVVCFAWHRTEPFPREENAHQTSAPVPHPRGWAVGLRPGFLQPGPPADIPVRGFDDRPVLAPDTVGILFGQHPGILEKFTTWNTLRNQAMSDFLWSPFWRQQSCR